jgi:hypothetical protein
VMVVGWLACWREMRVEVPRLREWLQSDLLALVHLRISISRLQHKNIRFWLVKKIVDISEPLDLTGRTRNTRTLRTRQYGAHDYFRAPGGNGKP